MLARCPEEFIQELITSALEDCPWRYSRRLAARCASASCCWSSRRYDVVHDRTSSQGSTLSGRSPCRTRCELVRSITRASIGMQVDGCVPARPSDGGWAKRQRETGARAQGCFRTCWWSLLGGNELEGTCGPPSRSPCPPKSSAPRGQTRLAWTERSRCFGRVPRRAAPPGANPQVRTASIAEAVGFASLRDRKTPADYRPCARAGACKPAPVCYGLEFRRSRGVTSVRHRRTAMPPPDRQPR